MKNNLKVYGIFLILIPTIIAFILFLILNLVHAAIMWEWVDFSDPNFWIIYRATVIFNLLVYYTCITLHFVDEYNRYRNFK